MQGEHPSTELHLIRAPVPHTFYGNCFSNLLCLEMTIFGDDPVGPPPLSYRRRVPEEPMASQDHAKIQQNNLGLDALDTEPRNQLACYHHEDMRSISPRLHAGSQNYQQCSGLHISGRDDPTREDDTI